MSCTLNNGFQIDLCNNNSGGVLKMYIQNFDERTFTFGTGASASLITAMSGATPSFYTHELPKSSSSLTSTSTTDEISGSTVFAETGEFIIHSLNTDTLSRIKTLAKGKFRVVIIDENGKYIMAGRERGVRFNITSTTGKGIAEMNGATLALVGEEKNELAEVNPTLMLTWIQA